MAESDDIAYRNEVHLVGRISAVPEERTLPSGDRIVSWRLVVARDRGHDTLDCTAWTARARRTAAGFREGDVVEVDGSLRRRFWRAPSGGPASRYDVEVAKARRIAR